MQYVDHKHFMSKKTGRNFPLSTCSGQTHSLPLLLSLLGNGEAKARSVIIYAEPQQAAASPGFPVSCPSHYCSTEGWAEFQGRRQECTDQEPQPLEAGTSSNSLALEVPRHFTQIPVNYKVGLEREFFIKLKAPYFLISNYIAKLR